MKYRLATLKYLAGAALICCALALTLAACGSSSSKTGSGGSSSSSPTSSPTPSGTPTAQSILARTKQQNLTSATFTLNQQIQTQQGNLTSQGTGQLQEHPFAEQVALTTTLNGSQVQSQAIYSGNNIYSKTANSSTWTETPAGDVVNGSSAAPDLANVADLPNATLVGTETVTGVKTYHLKGTGTQTANGQSVAYTEDLWIRQDNYRPEQVTDVVTAPVGNIQSTVIFTNWNTNVSIQTPPPSAVSTITIPTTPTP